MRPDYNWPPPRWRQRDSRHKERPSCTAAPHCGAARNSAKTKASSSVFVFGSFSGFVLGDSSVMVPFFGAAHSVRDSTSAERAAQERVRSKLRTWAAAPDEPQAPAVW